METNLSKLTEMAWQNMIIDANDEHTLVQVAFPKSVTEWFTEGDLTHFVANLIPLYDWHEEGILKHKNDEAEYIFVTLWWSDEGEPCEPYLRALHDKALLAEQREGGDYGDDGREDDKIEWYEGPKDGELHLDQEGQRRLADLVRSSVIDEFLVDEEELPKAEWFWVKSLVLDQDLYRLFGMRALEGIIEQVFPGWTVEQPVKDEGSSLIIYLYSEPIGNIAREAVAA